MLKAPMTAEERIFAEQNYPLLITLCKVHNIPRDAQDAADEGYLDAVVTWFTRPDLRGRFKFGTVLYWQLKKAMLVNYRSHDREIKHIAYSLDSELPDGDSMGALMPDESPSVEDCIDFDLEEAIRKRLTPNESLTLDYLLAGWNQSEIADRYGLTHTAISKRVGSIRQKSRTILR